MNPPSSKPPGSAGETQTIDLQDVELLFAGAKSERSERSLPPPLPPEVRASHVPAEPPAPEAPAGRSTAFYLVALLVFLVVGVGGGLLVAVKLRQSVAAPVVTVPSGGPQAAVITIPTVEVADDVDGGGK